MLIERNPPQNNVFHCMDMNGGLPIPNCCPVYVQLIKKYSLLPQYQKLKFTYRLFP